MEGKNVLMAIVLSTLVLVVWATFFESPPVEKQIAEKSKASADTSGMYPDPIVTEISPLGIFYVAENYHQDYYRVNPSAPYCLLVIQPKLDKLSK